MECDEVRKLSVEERYWYFVGERERVRLRRETGAPKPWTDDTILQSYRFCNMRRMDDKVSLWLLENWYTKFKDHPLMLTAAALARFINKPESLDLITHTVFGDAWRPDRLVEILRKRREAGGTVFNGAYMVRGNDGMDKIDCVVNYYVGPLLTLDNPVDPTSMERTHTNLLQSFGMGSFMAGQIVADLRWGVTGRWGDRRRWAPIGPGSLRGMNRLYSRELKATITQIAFETNLSILISKAEVNVWPEMFDRMEAQDWQNTLCEFDKYERALGGEGQPKQKYQGAN